MNKILFILIAILLSVDGTSAQQTAPIITYVLHDDCISWHIEPFYGHGAIVKDRQNMLLLMQSIETADGTFCAEGDMTKENMPGDQYWLQAYWMDNEHTYIVETETFTMNIDYLPQVQQ